MRYVTSTEMRELDRQAIERGTSAALLMERAGSALSEEVKELSPIGGILILAGYGNNGGDGLVAARFLLEAGYKVNVVMAGEEKELSDESKYHYDLLQSASGKPPQKIEIAKVAESVTFSEAGCIVDAIFGIGFHGKLSEDYIKLFDTINKSGIPIVSADIPSGLDADTGKALPVAIEASKTVTFGYPKMGFKFPRAKKYIGELVIADIGV